MTTPTQVSEKRSGRGKGLLIATTLFAVAGLSYYFYHHSYGQYHEQTDDAYVGTNMVYVNSQVGGSVVAVKVEDNQPVKAGAVLVCLDDADAKAALAETEARLGEAVRQVRTQFRNVEAASAVLEQRRAELARTENDLRRRSALAGTDAIATEDIEHASEAVAIAKAALVVSERQLELAKVPVEGVTLLTQPSVLRARAAYVQASLAVQRNQILAPADGTVARRSVQLGQRIAPGAPLLALVPLHAVWVDANFKEPQLRNIRIGQPARVVADLYGSQVEYHGKVAGISAGSGAAFSLLPPQNATGNWIKIVQRVPVRIALDPEELARNPLRVGLSMDVAVDTHERDGRVDTALAIPHNAGDTDVFASQLQSAEREADAIIAREAAGAR